jgi:hypothetical protein
MVGSGVRVGEKRYGSDEEREGEGAVAAEEGDDFGTSRACTSKAGRQFGRGIGDDKREARRGQTATPSISSVVPTGRCFDTSAASSDNAWGSR